MTRRTAFRRGRTNCRDPGCVEVDADGFRIYRPFRVHVGQDDRTPWKAPLECGGRPPAHRAVPAGAAPTPQSTES